MLGNAKEPFKTFPSYNASYRRRSPSLDSQVGSESQRGFQLFVLGTIGAFDPTRSQETKRHIRKAYCVMGNYVICNICFGRIGVLGKEW